MATYVNDLRLKEISTGDESGTWGTSTNTNLELIGEALGYATQQVFSSDADATTTVADGASDPARAMYFKITSAGNLTATRTCTIAPNTVSRVMFIENATSGSQSIAISQGSGANVTIATGKTAVVYLDGAGAGAAVVDAMAGVDPGVTDTLAEVLTAGNTTTTDQKIQFRDTGIYINSSADGQLDLVADTEIQIAASTVDLNGNLDISGTATGASSFATAAGGTFTTAAGNDLNLVYPDGRSLFFKEAGTTTLTLDNAQGATFAGTIAAGAATFTTADNNAQLTLISTDADANAGPLIVLDRNSASPADGDVIGSINFNGKNDAAEAHGYAKIESRIVDASNATEDGRLELATSVAGTEGISRILMDATETVVNDNSVDLDFRVESDGASHMLFVDAGNNRVGIGESSPDTPLHLTTSGTGFAVTIESTSGSATSGPDISIFRNSPSPADEDDLGRIYFHGENDGGTKIEYAMIRSSVNDVTAGTEDSSLQFYTYVGGAQADRLAIEATETVLNESSKNVDFRVESDNLTHALFVEGGTGQLRVNTANWPTNTFGDSAGRHIVGGPNEPLVVLWNEASAAANNISTLAIGAKSATATTAFGGGWIRGGLENNSDSDGFLGFYTTADAGTNTEQLRIASSGAATFSSSVTATKGIFTQAGGDFAAVFTTPFDYVAKFESTDSAAFIVLEDNNSTDNANRIGAVGDSIQIESGNVENALFTSTASVFNENSVDMDFRVESDNNANMLFVDGGNDNVVIGNSGASNSSQHLAVHGNTGLGNRLTSSSGGGYVTEISGTSLTTDGSNWYGSYGVLNFYATASYTGSARRWTLTNGYRTNRFAFLVGDTDTTSQPELDGNGGQASNAFSPLWFDSATGGATFNDDSKDADFRVESDGNANMLFVDAGNDAVGIGGTPNTSSQLTIDASSDANLVIRADNSMTFVQDALWNSSIFGGAYWNGQAKYGATNRSVTRLYLGHDGDATPSSQGLLVHASAQGAANANVTFESLASITRAGTVFNEDSYDRDFRVESNNSANMFFLDASTDRIGIGASAPTDPFTISSSFLTVNTPGTQLAIYGFDNDSVFKIGQDGNNSSLLTMSDSAANETVRITGHGGTLTISGALSKGSGSFKIDHPLPAKTDTHHLVHSFLEAPQADNLYRGKVDLVAGSASVNIDTVAGMTDGTFVLLNREVQCFTSNESGWTAVRGSVSGNTLTITAQDNTCVDTISWLVIGERQDQHMYDTEWTDSNGKVIVEPLKGE